MGNEKKSRLNEYPRQGDEEPKLDLVGNVADADSQERLVKADDDAVHLENMRNVQGSNREDKRRTRR